MRMRRIADLMARIPPSLADRVCRSIAPLLLSLNRRGLDSWEANLRAKGIGAARRGDSKRRLLANQLLLQYESLAMLGGRRFSVLLAGEEHLWRALRIGRGLLIATAHMGNWHLAAAEVHARTGRMVHSVAGTQMFRGWTEDLRAAYGELGLRIHDSARSAPRLVEALRSREIVALHIDGDQHGGLGTATRGIVLLARRTGAPILPTLSSRTASGKIAVEFLPHLRPVGGRIDPCTIDRLLVDAVRMRPEQWVLFRPLWNLP